MKDETKEIILGLITIAEEKHNYLKALKKLKKIGIKTIQHNVYKLP